MEKLEEILRSVIRIWIVRMTPNFVILKVVILARDDKVVFLYVTIEKRRPWTPPQHFLTTALVMTQ